MRSASQKQPRPAATKVAAGERDSAEPADDSDEEVVRETGSMAVATLISRITGFLRTVLIGSGVRHSKLLVPGALLVALPGAERVEDLGVRPA